MGGELFLFTLVFSLISHFLYIKLLSGQRVHCSPRNSESYFSVHMSALPSNLNSGALIVTS